MGQIADLLQQKAGLSPEKSQEVEQIVTEHIMAKVPSQFQGMLGSVLGTGGDASGEQADGAESGGLGGMLGAVSGMFGGNKS